MNTINIQVFRYTTIARKTFFQTMLTSVISRFSHKADENCTLLSYYAASSGNFLLTFQDNLSVPSSDVDKELLPLAV